MSNGKHASPGRLDELLADRATQYLSDEEQRELAELLTSKPHAYESTFDHAAATVDLAWTAGAVEPMPDALRSQVETQALAWLAEKKGLRVTGAAPRTSRGRSPRPRPGTWIPWTLAAACLVAAAIGWWPATVTRTPAPATACAALLRAPGTRTVIWQTAPDGVTGDVVWNTQRQEGYLRLSGLAANDPGVMQYQLWIFDEARGDYSEDVAVDGGVFDVGEGGGDVVVPIRAKLPVRRPALFAVTTEPPGGVVKHNSDRDPQRYRIILTAPL